jgi:hypothetical protein
MAMVGNLVVCRAFHDSWTRWWPLACTTLPRRLAVRLCPKRKSINPGHCPGIVLLIQGSSSRCNCFSISCTLVYVLFSSCICDFIFSSSSSSSLGNYHFTGTDSHCDRFVSIVLAISSSLSCKLSICHGITTVSLSAIALHRFVCNLMSSPSAALGTQFCSVLFATDIIYDGI